MKCMRFTFLILGFAVPLALLSVQYILLVIDPEYVSRFRAMWYYLWPTAIFLIAAAGASTVIKVLILGIAIAGNMVIYGLIGVLLRRICRFVAPAAN
jgi:hypothetical protein